MQQIAFSVRISYVTFIHPAVERHAPRNSGNRYTIVRHKLTFPKFSVHKQPNKRRVRWKHAKFKCFFPYVAGTVGCPYRNADDFSCYKRGIRRNFGIKFLIKAILYNEQEGNIRSFLHNISVAGIGQLYGGHIIHFDAGNYFARFRIARLVSRNDNNILYLPGNQIAAVRTAHGKSAGFAE